MIGTIAAKNKVRSAYDSLNRRDLDSFLAQFEEDAKFIYPNEEVEGKEAIGAWFQKMMDRFPGVSFTLNSICVEKIFTFGGTNIVATEWDLALADAKGEEFRNTGADIFSLENGKIAVVRSYPFDVEAQKKASG